LIFIVLVEVSEVVVPTSHQCASILSLFFDPVFVEWVSGGSEGAVVGEVAGVFFIVVVFFCGSESRSVLCARVESSLGGVPLVCVWGLTSIAPTSVGSLRLLSGGCEI
jgi:hypothetical protein